MDAPTPGTYPPSRHLLRDLGLVVEHRPDGAGRGTVAVHPGLTDPGGRPWVGVVATLVDVVAGGLAARVAAPGWIATADLDLALVDAGPCRRVGATGAVVHAGRSTVVVGVELDADGAPLGLASLAFAVLQRRRHNPEVPVARTERWELGAPATSRSIVDEAGIRAHPGATDGRRDGTTVPGATMPVSPYVRNSLGATQGGALALLAEQAALRHGSSGAPSARLVDLHLTYLALARTGPLEAHVVAGSEEATRVLEILDTGAQGRTTTLVTATVVPASPGVPSSSGRSTW